MAYQPRLLDEWPAVITVAGQPRATDFADAMRQGSKVNAWPARRTLGVTGRFSANDGHGGEQVPAAAHRVLLVGRCFGSRQVAPGVTRTDLPHAAQRAGPSHRSS